MGGRWSWRVARAGPMALRPSVPAAAVAVRALSAWRRDVGVERALLNASNWVTPICVRSFTRRLLPYQAGHTTTGARHAGRDRFHHVLPTVPVGAAWASAP